MLNTKNQLSNFTTFKLFNDSKTTINTPMLTMINGLMIIMIYPCTNKPVAKAYKIFSCQPAGWYNFPPTGIIQTDKTG
ncbi:hypothetical protein BEL04_14160 [Mucilaginibacter sp. PPCGB 2223]|nr:hypothetical protein BEL04_14160 [Mucilaginibacter sp. PPCGB 2223]